MKMKACKGLNFHGTLTRRMALLVKDDIVAGTNTKTLVAVFQSPDGSRLPGARRLSNRSGRRAVPCVDATFVMVTTHRCTAPKYPVMNFPCQLRERGPHQLKPYAPVLGIPRSLAFPGSWAIRRHPIDCSRSHQSFHSLVRSSLPVGEPSGRWAPAFGTRDI